MKHFALLCLLTTTLFASKIPMSQLNERFTHFSKSNLPLYIHGWNALILTGKIDSIQIITPENTTNQYCFPAEYGYYFTADQEGELQFPKSLQIVIRYSYTPAIGGMGYNRPMPKVDDKVLLISDQWSCKFRDHTPLIEIVLSDDSDSPLFQTIKVDETPRKEGIAESFATSESSNEQIRYWQYLYWLSVKKDLNERIEIVQRLAKHLNFSYGSDRIERYKKMIDLNFYDLRRRERKRLYKHLKQKQ